MLKIIKGNCKRNKTSIDILISSEMDTLKTEMDILKGIIHQIPVAYKLKHPIPFSEEQRSAYEVMFPSIFVEINDNFDSTEKIYENEEFEHVYNIASTLFKKLISKVKKHGSINDMACELNTGLPHLYPDANKLIEDYNSFRNKQLNGIPAFGTIPWLTNISEYATRSHEYGRLKDIMRIKEIGKETLDITHIRYAYRSINQKSGNDFTE